MSDQRDNPLPSHGAPDASPSVDDETLRVAGAETERSPSVRPTPFNTDDVRQADANIPPAAVEPVEPAAPSELASAEPTLLPSGGDQTAAAAKRPIIPGHEILDTLGRGGMGIVYRARHMALGRTVAVKMLISGHLAPEELLDRFQCEAESVARLKHPNIVQIYETGDVQGQPYFTLEYVAGGSLADRLDGSPQDSQAAARLVAQLADAVYYAHTMGVLHRDLKPANVLLEEDGTPKITDFGLARQMESDVRHTRTGDVMGTPSYMAPEQASGVTRKLDPACDIYSLGALLYEMLTGRPPFRGRDAVDTLMQVIADEVVAPRRLQSGLPRDLETICLKCLEKSPSKRYPTAAALADDLRRFLRHEPIVARPASGVERAMKFVRRRPAWAALWGVSALAISLTLVATLFYSLRVTQWNHQISAAYDRQKQTTMAALDYVDQVIDDVAGDRLAIVPEGQSARRDLLRDAMLFCQRLLEQQSSDVDVQFYAARAQRQLADLQQATGETTEAEQAYRQALAMFANIPAQSAVHLPVARETAAAHINLGNLFERAGDLELAASHYKQAIRALADRVKGRDASEDELRLVAAAHGNLGVLYERLGHVDESGKEFEQAINLLASAAENSSDPMGRLQMASALSNQGMLFKVVGNTDAALATFLRALEILETSDQETASRPEFRLALASAQNNLAAVYQVAQQYEQAVESYRSAVDIFTQLTSDFPGTLEYLRGWADARNNLTRLLIEREQWDEALAMARATAEQLRTLADRFPGEAFHEDALATARQLEASTLIELDSSRDAERALSDALRLRRDLVDRFPAQPVYRARLASVLHSVAEMLLEAGRASDAAVLLFEAVDQQQQAVSNQAFPSDLRSQLWKHYVALSEALIASEQPARAAEVASRMQELFPNGEDQLFVAGVLAQCIPLITAAKSDASGPVEGLPLDEFCQEKAFDLLRVALLSGQITLEEIENSPRFAAIRKLSGWRERITGQQPDI